MSSFHPPIPTPETRNAARANLAAGFRSTETRAPSTAPAPPAAPAPSTAALPVPIPTRTLPALDEYPGLMSLAAISTDEYDRSGLSAPPSFLDPTSHAVRFSTGTSSISSSSMSSSASSSASSSVSSSVFPSVPEEEPELVKDQASCVICQGGIFDGVPIIKCGNGKCVASFHASCCMQYLEQSENDSLCCPACNTGSVDIFKTDMLPDFTKPLIEKQMASVSKKSNESSHSFFTSPKAKAEFASEVFGVCTSMYHYGPFGGDRCIDKEEFDEITDRLLWAPGKTNRVWCNFKRGSAMQSAIVSEALGHVKGLKMIKRRGVCSMRFSPY